MRQLEVPVKRSPKPFHHRLHRPVLPQEAVPSPRAEIRDPQVGQLAQPLDLFPQAGHGAGIEDLQLEPAHVPKSRARAQLHQDGQGRDLPQHDLGPRALEGQLVLPVAFAEMVGGQAKPLEELHEVRPEHLALAIEGVAAQPGAFAARQRQAAHMVQLLAQLAFVDQLGQADVGAAIDQAEGDGACRAGCERPTGTSAACRNPCRSATGRSGRSSTCGYERAWRYRPWTAPSVPGPLVDRDGGRRKMG